MVYINLLKHELCIKTTSNKDVSAGETTGCWLTVEDSSVSAAHVLTEDICVIELD